MIPLLTRIDRQLQATADPDSRAELLAERACYMARVGDFAGSKRIIESLRAAYGDGRNPRVSVWIMLVEGVSMYFECLSDRAYGRILRASEVSHAFGMRSLGAICSAWLAHMELDKSNYARMVMSINRAASFANASTYDLNTRIGLILGDAYLLSGNRTRSQVWYSWARSNALSAGDQAAVGALMYNRSAFGLAWSRISKYLDNVRIGEFSASILALETESSLAFQRATNITALSHLSELWRARSRILTGDYESALTMLIALQRKVRESEDRKARSPLLGDIAICLARLARCPELRDIIAQVSRAEFLALDADDRVVLIGSILEATRLCNISFTGGDLLRDFDLAKSEYLSDLSSLRSEIASLDSVLPNDLFKLEPLVASPMEREKR